MAQVLGIPADINEPTLYALSPSRIQKIITEARASLVEAESDPLQTVILDCTLVINSDTTAQIAAAETAQGVDPNQVPVDPTPVE